MSERKEIIANYMNLDSTQLKKLRGLILYTVVVAVGCVHYKEVLAVLGRGVHMILPFLVGCAIAFILNVPMRRIETQIAGKGANKRWHRPVSLLITLIFVLGILAVVIFVVAPEFANTAVGLKKSVPVFADR
ncbi:hypothetical protein [Clostridium sp. AM58-1XD]|uniref:hypothetical protein n=1 Tax=Clostridium sp. AM58-1XD TaxID=2292307 RepID=UPI00268F1D17